jgi:uncharacterized protein
LAFALGNRTMRIENEWMLAPQRVAIHLPSATAVVADLHLGYNSARQRRGDALPRASLEGTLAPLQQVLAQHRVKRLVVAGDLVEEELSVELSLKLQRWLAEMQIEAFSLVPGNHDRRGITPGTWVSIAPRGLMLGRWLVVHGDRKLPACPTVSGHLHPALELQGHHHPCFLWKPGRLLLPAYTQDSRGVSQARSPGWCDCHCLVPVAGEVLDFGPIGGVEKAIKQRKEPPARRHRKLFAINRP